jgi:hypothetical protein
MKGPFERLKYDLRRIWECPACGARQRTDGSETTRFCQCGKPNTNPLVSMKLISDGPRRTVPPIAPPQIEQSQVEQPPVEQPPVDVAEPAASETAPAVPTQIEVTQVEVLAAAPIEIMAVKAVEVILPPTDPPGPST